MTARSDGSTSPCATTTALMAKIKAAPERRSQGVSRVSTPYADITQIRFWGLRLSALSAPLSSGAPPSYSVVCASSVCRFRRTRRGPSPSPGLVLNRPISSRGLAPAPLTLSGVPGASTSRRFAVLRLAAHHDHVAVRWRDEPRHHQDRER